MQLIPGAMLYFCDGQQLEEAATFPCFIGSKKGYYLTEKQLKDNKKTRYDEKVAFLFGNTVACTTTKGVPLYRWFPDFEDKNIHFITIGSRR